MKNWKKSILIVCTVIVAGYMIAAVTVFNKPPEGMTCSKVDIEISDDSEDGFLSANEIKHILINRNLYPLETAMGDIDTREIEEALKKSPFVKTAECYKTPEGHICINLTQRMPVIRIMSVNGDDYYLDDQGGIMPNVKYSSDIVIATGYISRKYAQAHLGRIGKYLMYDRFWQNCIEQINVLRDGSIEIVPRIGDHIAFLGRPVFIQDKLTRLRKFYKYGLSQVGWNKYSYISLEFGNQIICKKRKTI